MTILKLLARAVIGGTAGAFLSVPFVAFLSLVIAYDPLQNGFGPLLGAAWIGAFSGACATVIAGSWKIRGIPRYVVVGMPIGCALGIFGGILYAILFMLPGADPRPLFFSGIIMGMRVGTLLGGTIGLLVGVIWEPSPDLGYRNKCRAAHSCD